jgi:type II secretory pathway pseudopilin PulG
MSMTRSRRIEAFTRRDLLAVIVVSVVVGIFLVGILQRAQLDSQRDKTITCVNNLKRLGTAYRIWANDNGDKFPAATPLTKGGWCDLLERTNASAYYWTNYVVMANELGQNPFVLVCPSDERKPANSLSNLSNTNISYFGGVNANDTYPQSLLGGDRNLGPGTNPDAEYGFSPADGRGNDVVISGPVCWSLKMHTRGDSLGVGNILLGDGSAQQSTSRILNEYWMKKALAEKAGHDKATNVAQLRLIFP